MLGCAEPGQAQRCRHPGGDRHHRGIPHPGPEPRTLARLLACLLALDERAGEHGRLGDAGPARIDDAPADGLALVDLPDQVVEARASDFDVGVLLAREEVRAADRDLVGARFDATQRDLSAVFDRRKVAKRAIGTLAQPTVMSSRLRTMNSASADHSKYTWANAAYAMATNINRSYKLYGWGSRIRGIESGGAVENLPLHTFPTDDGGVDQKYPTEIAISDRREAELAKNGFMPLVHRKNSDFAAFIGAQSLHKPAEYDDPDASANAKLAARLPYLFATCRFAHYLKCIVRDKIGSFKERDEVQRWLGTWISQYVDGDPARSSEAYKASHPLAAAEVVVEEDPSNPGYYSSKFFLRPHYQLDNLRRFQTVLRYRYPYQMVLPQPKIIRLRHPLLILRLLRHHLEEESKCNQMLMNQLPMF